MSEWDWPVPLRCARCGKDVFIPEKVSWAYKKTPGSNLPDKTKHNTKYFCSWSCMRVYEAETGNGMKRNVRIRK